MFALAVLASLVGGVAAASTLTETIDPAPKAPAAGVQAGDLEPEPGSDSAEGLARPNDGPPWTVLVWTSKTDKRCAVVGQYVDGQVGRLYANDPQFHPYPKEEGPACVDPAEVPGKAALDPRVSGEPLAEGGPVTLVWGTVSEAVTSVEVVADGSRRTLTPTKRRAFIAGFPGFPLRGEVTVTATLEDGSTRSHRFPPFEAPPPEALEHPGGSDHP
jgi:hypothetical protein